MPYASRLSERDHGVRAFLGLYRDIHRLYRGNGKKIETTRDYMGFAINLTCRILGC